MSPDGGGAAPTEDTKVTEMGKHELVTREDLIKFGYLEIVVINLVQIWFPLVFGFVSL